jgi:hypothetical protein
MNQIVPILAARTPAKTRSRLVVPAAIAGAGDTAVRRFLEFFAATIRNKNTRMAYYRAVVAPNFLTTSRMRIRGRSGFQAADGAITAPQSAVPPQPSRGRSDSSR